MQGKLRNVYDSFRRIGSVVLMYSVAILNIGDEMLNITSIKFALSEIVG